MSITYLIGNGFDISVGLNTRYCDFYDYITNNYSDIENYENDILQNIKNNRELWSNFELKLGEYTKEIGDDDNRLEKFSDDKFDIEKKLMEYLRIEQDRIDWDEKNVIQKVKENFLKYFYQFYELFTPVERDEILKIVNSLNGVYKVISFNYTNVIKNCVNLLENKIEILYLHGSLEKNNAILGVNDSEQIENEYFRDTEEMLIGMSKIEINNDIGEYTIPIAQNILMNSKIVCIYGMSIGDTDKFWWQQIINNLINGFCKMVVIFNYDPELDINNRVKYRKAKNNIKNQLLKFSAEDEKLRSELKSKIKVICNSNMFKLDFKFKDSNESEKLIDKMELIVT